MVVAAAAAGGARVCCHPSQCFPKRTTRQEESVTCATRADSVGERAALLF